MEDIYEKILIAKFSTKNECYSEDGEILTVFPHDITSLRESTEHFFNGIYEPHAKSKYGWVKKTAPFTLCSFINRYKLFNEATLVEINHVQTILRAISRIAEGQAVGAAYTMRGVIKKEVVFTVHRVIFY